MSKKPEKIAILGGGAGAMAAAWALTKEHQWQSKYEITVYQMGWRLGGKGASGRNQYHAERIEEHGLHIFLGFYINAFKMLKDTYDELDRPKYAPLARIEQAFKKFGYIGVPEYIDDAWRFWMFNFPFNDHVPWEGQPNTIWDSLRMLVEGLADYYNRHPLSDQLPSGEYTGDLASTPQPSSAGETSPTEKRPGLLGHLFHSVEKGIEDGLQFAVNGAKAVVHAVDEVLTGTEDEGEELALSGLQLALQMIRSLPQDPTLHSEHHHSTILEYLRDFFKFVKQVLWDRIEESDEWRHLFYLLDLGIPLVIGLLESGAVTQGLDVIDEWDLREWLMKYGSSQASVDSPLIMAWYDLAFAYEGGSAKTPNFAAGAALRAIFRTVLEYRGSIFWKMQAGMGDTVFGPLYEVLKRRGVKFKFFHKIEKLHVNGNVITSIDVEKQVDIKDDKEYEPLVNVKGLPCWPSYPLYEQIVQGKALQKEEIDLESFWTTWKGKSHSLTYQKDFDTVIFGISLGSVPYLCEEMLQANSSWQEMVEHVKTVETQAVQLWFQPALDGLGWELPSPVVDSYAQPLNTWADMSFLLPRESWPNDAFPFSLQYFCGAMEGPPIAPPPEAKNYPKEQAEAMRERTRDFFNNQAWGLWPYATNPAFKYGLNWDLLVSIHGAEGVERLYEQYLRINIDPSQRYVMSVKGSTKFRLFTERSGFANLYPVGDWLNSGINSGDVEAAVITGLQASRAISGWPEVIPGESDHTKPLGGK